MGRIAGMATAAAIPTTQVPAPIALPPPPRSVDETGLPVSFINYLVLKVIYFNGSMLGRDIAAHTCLEARFIEQKLFRRRPVV